MSELKRDYWSDTLVCITGKVKIDRREIAAIVISPVKKPVYYTGNETHEDYNHLNIHLKSGTIFTVKEYDVNTIANLYLTQSPHEEVHIVPNNKQESEE
jgi:hypothetical protein